MRILAFNQSYKLFLLVLCMTCAMSHAQESAIVQKELQKLVKKGQLQTQDIGDWVVTSQHTSSTSGVHHIYYRQQIDGIQIYGAEASAHSSKEGKIIAAHNSFIPDVGNRVSGSRTPVLTPIQALDKAAQQLGMGNASGRILTTNTDKARTTTLEAPAIARSPINAKLMYHFDEKTGARLVWDLSIEAKNTVNWWNVRIDAATGALLDKVDWTVECNNGDDHVHDLSAAPKVTAALATTNTTANTAYIGNYEVYAMPLESPAHGTMNRTIVANPDDGSVVGSPFGWHDTNGVLGNEFTTTRGNNVNAYEDGDNPGYAPDGGATLDFTTANPLEDFSVNTTYSTTDQSEAAAITNLFYWSNIIHDVFYVYGLDEAAGNFQQNNYGNGGAGNDFVRAEAQDGSGSCNANMSTPPDGSPPRMQMYTCGARDGDFDNGVVVHEYGHGISIRLTGGAGTSGCLSGAEQMGEGWSDWFGLIMTIEPGDSGEDARGIGTWLFGQGPTGGGIRPQPYSTDNTTADGDPAINTQSYDNIITATPPHGVGSVWATMLWEVTWALIDDHGIDTDLYNFTGDVNLDAGNVQALALVVEGLKLQPCAPGFIDGRDAIIAADEAIYGGANYCTLWEAFAKRGLGFYADQGSSSSQTDNSENYDPPTLTLETIAELCIGEGEQLFAGAFPDGGVFSGPGVVDQADGVNYTFDPAVAGVGTHTITYTIPSPLCSDPATTVTSTIEVTDGMPEIVCQDISIDLDSNGLASITQADVVSNLLPATYEVDQSGVFAPIDITATGTAVVLGDDQVSGGLSIGFPFTFYGTDYSTFYISSNGFITFNNASDDGCCTGESIPSAGGNADNYIAVAWEDLNPAAGGTIRYETVGTAPNRKLIVEYDNIVYWNTTKAITAQLHLFEGSTRIEIHSTSIPSDGNTTQGIENNGGTEGLATPGRNSSVWSASNDFVAFYLGTPSSADNCGSPTTISLSTTDFTCADLGDNTVTVTITDGLGNASSCDAIVTVNAGSAPVAPIAVCQDITVQLDASGVANITANDIDDGSSLCGGGTPILSTDISQFGCDDIGVNTVILTVSDSGGQSTTCSATVTVQDLIAPTVVCQDITVTLDASGNAAITAADIDNGSSDFCGIATTAIDVTAFSCTDIGVNPVTLTVTDVNGNSDQCIAMVTVVDSSLPTVVCQDITVALDAVGQAVITTTDIDNGSFDNCGVDALALDINTFTCDDIGTNTVILTVTDVNGNSADCTATVTVEDTIGLTVNGPGDLNEETTNTDTACETIVTYDPVTGSDNCGEDQIVVVQTAGLGSGAAFPVGTTTESYELTDVNGVVTTYSFDVTVTDNTDPVITNCPGATVETVPTGTSFVIPDYTLQLSVTDNCGATPVLTQVPAPGVELLPGSSTSIIITAEDDAGNSSQCSFSLSVEETLSVSEAYLDTHIMMYPNPVANILTISYKGTTKLTEIHIYDVTGKHVFADANPSALSHVALQQLAAGIYFVQISDTDATIIKRVIKK